MIDNFIWIDEFYFANQKRKWLNLLMIRQERGDQYETFLESFPFQNRDSLSRLAPSLLLLLLLLLRLLSSSSAELNILMSASLT